MSTANHTAITKPSIVKDALYGLLTAAVIGVLTSFAFIMVVLLLSSQAFASSNSNALFPASVNPTATTERGYFFYNTGQGDAGEFKTKELFVR